MKKKILITILSSMLLVGANIYGQNKHSKIIISEANIMANSLKEKKYEILIKYTYPKLVEFAGGKTNIINDISAQIKKMESDGVKFGDVIIGEPRDIFVAGDELHCLVPQELIMEVPKGKVISNSFLLAISMDNGKSWYFIDTNQLNKEKADQLFPKFNHDLEFPEKTAPKFIPN